MNLETFKLKRLNALAQAPKFRKLCSHCRQPDFSCYCGWLEPLDPGIDFVILIHPIEARRRIATGRMSHLELINSTLIVGCDYSKDPVVRQILNDRSRFNVMLYPGGESKNLTPMATNERLQVFPKGKKLTIFVIDGTWATARKMVRLSENIRSLPRICFTPPSPSTFRIRKQPNKDCYSTIEAIHQTIELLGPNRASREHDRLLVLFDKLVQRQIELAHCGKPQRR
jgi:DTW domain-containing protein YfiP